MNFLKAIQTIGSNFILGKKQQSKLSLALLNDAYTITLLMNVVAPFHIQSILPLKAGYSWYSYDRSLSLNKLEPSAIFRKMFWWFISYSKNTKWFTSKNSEVSLFDFKYFHVVYTWLSWLNSVWVCVYVCTLSIGMHDIRLRSTCGHNYNCVRTQTVLSMQRL